MRNNLGLTFVELILVIVIIAIMSAMTLPTFHNWTKKYYILNSTKKVFSDIHQIKLKAFTEKRTCGIFWPTSNTKIYYLRCDTDYDNDINDDGGYETLLSVSLDEIFVFNAGISQNFRFTKDGIAIDLGHIRSFELNVTPRYNCINISRTRIKMGVWSSDENECQVK